MGPPSRLAGCQEMSMQSALLRLRRRGGRAYRLGDECDHVLRFVNGVWLWMDDDGLVFPFRPTEDDVLNRDWIWESN